MKFEVLVSDLFVVLKHGASTLWWTRPTHTTPTNSPLISVKADSSPEFRVIKDDELSCFESFTCHGIAYGVVGIFQNDKLILVKQNQSVGRLPFGYCDEVFRIQKISVLSLSTKCHSLGDLGLDDTCTRPVIIVPSPNEASISASFKDSEESTLTIHHSFSASAQPLVSSLNVQKTWNQIKQTASNVKPRVGNKFTSASTNQSQNRLDEKEKFERRFVDELYKMFNETNSFYYSWTGDLTNSVQRQQKRKLQEATTQEDIRLIPLWKRVDDRFFWNKHMLQSVIDVFDAFTPTNEKPNVGSEEKKTYSHIWVLPVVQGFVQIEKCFFDLNESSPVGSFQKDFPTKSENGSTKVAKKSDPKVNLVNSFLQARDYYWMALISRRSRFRAGTRYKKRGLDENGRCANYVETEQIFTYGTHTVSFVCIRGSVPLFWSQMGYKYRPPPRLERTEIENQQAFREHFDQEFAIYGENLVAVSLVEHTGREKVLNDAFLEHVVHIDDPRLTYVTFDFHDYCRGMKFENVTVLIDKIYELIKDVRYCWLDTDGLICEQRGVFRINCVDCLDRTNIVMTAIAKAVMDIQLVRLGLLPPEGQLPANSRRIFQLMWAHNGDIISRQYAGTAALKGDFTRTGERKISGVVRDGYNSANRYYLNRFKDAYRQAVIDIMQGNPVSDVLSSPENEKSLAKQIPTSATSASLSNSDQEYHERIKLVIEDCKKILVPEEEVILGGWPLVDADPVTGTLLSSSRVNGELPDSEMDIVLILTKDCYYVADYDDQTDRIVKYQKVLLEDLEKIELGAEPNYQNGPFAPIRNQSSRVISYAVRFHYLIADQSGYFHMFRSTGTRFFNNMAIPIRTREEALESLKAICESFKVALSVKSLNVPFHEVSRLERRKSKRLYSASFKLDSSNTSSHSSESRVRGSKETNSVGGSRKLFTGVYSHFSRLRGKLTGTAQTNPPPNRPTLDGIKPNLIELEDGEPQPTSQIEDEDEESDEDDSLFKLRKKRYTRQSTGGSNPSSLAVERAMSSDLSECSDFDDSEVMLPPIREIGSPSMDDESICARENMDRVLESCGILVTSPPLRHYVNFDELDSPQRHHLEQSKSLMSLTSDSKVKSVLHDVDDFVLDSMKKASLRQIHRKAVSQSQVSLFSSTNSINNNNNQADNPRINVESGNVVEGMMPTRGSSRCIFSSELALNSIVSQSIKKDIINKLSGSLSTDALDGGGGGSRDEEENNLAFQCAAYPLMSSSSFAALSYQDDNESEPLSLNVYSDSYGDNYDDTSPTHPLNNPNNLGVSSKESSLSASDLAFSGTHAILKTSRSSNTLQASSSGSMSLNLPSINSTSVLSITNECNTTAAATNATAQAPNFTSIVKKDLVLSPLTRIAKGMQSLGLNLRATANTEADSKVTTTTTCKPESKKVQFQTRTHIVQI